MKAEVKTQLVRAAEGGSLSDLGKVLDELATPTGPVKLATFTVATLPAAADYSGQIVYVSNGQAGTPCLAFSDGTNWQIADGSGNVAAA